MKTILKSRRPSPAEALAIATSTAPQQPSAQISETVPDSPTTLNLRIRTSTATALIDTAQSQGLTMKQVVCHALQAAGVAVAEADLEDRTPRRK